MNLIRLDWMIGDGTPPTPAAKERGEVAAAPGHRARALRTIEAFRRQWSRAPHALPQLLCALELALAEPRTVVLAGDPAAADFRALAPVLHEKLGLRRALLAADGAEGQRWLAERKPYLAAMKPVDGRATAYVCENFACQAPVTSPADLRALLG
jgi:uncharacterized protein YyaL (SSP411 family)